ncbi:MAG: hybrid sensor histidine kinase/response regulator [Pseudoxanthomonas sp.]
MNLVSPATISAGMQAEVVNLLIVDDIQQNLIAMEALLRRDGLNILCARSGPEALELLLQHDVALALLDVQMPEMDGFTLAELMRGSPRTRDVPIIFLTASPDDPQRSFKGYEAGAVDFLHKPIEPHIILGKVKVFIELYEQRRQLKTQNAALEHALRLNETMMAVLSHDLRTPLTTVLLCTDALGLALPQDDTQARKPLQRIDGAARRMARMVEQLLDFSRIRNGSLRLETRPCNLGEVTRTVADDVAHSHPTETITIEEQGNLSLHADADRVMQVLSNLLGNALVHGAGHPIEVRLDGRRAGTLSLEVRNTGAISDALMPRLFEPFKASFNPTQGLGLGLYIAQQFVQAHGGHLQAHNEQGQVVFRAELPRA